MGSTASLLKNAYARHFPSPKPGENVRLTASDGMSVERVWAEVRLVLLSPQGAPLLFLGSVRSMNYNVDGWEYGDKIIFSQHHIQELLGARLY